MSPPPISFFFFFNDTATTEIYTLSLHDALPICISPSAEVTLGPFQIVGPNEIAACFFFMVQIQPEDDEAIIIAVSRSEEHTSELQSQSNLVCRLLLEKKKKKHQYPFF